MEDVEQAEELDNLDEFDNIEDIEFEIIIISSSSSSSSSHHHIFSADTLSLGIIVRYLRLKSMSELWTLST